MLSQWEPWVAAVWPNLSAGQRVDVPETLPPPSWAGYVAPPLAEPVGQTADWVRSYDDGSRIHVHEYADGRRVVHRDAIDPARGPVQAISHWVTETKSAKVVLVAAFVFGVSVPTIKATTAPRRRRR